MPRLFVTTLLLLFPALAFADKVAPEPIRPGGIDGALVICGGGKLPDAVRDRFLELAGGVKAKVVVIPTASASADKEKDDYWLESWVAKKPASAVVLHTTDRKKADDAAFVAPLKEATGVWFSGGDQSRLTEAYRGTAVEKEVHALMKRGGVVGGTSAGAAVLSRVMIAGGNPDAKTATGFDLLPGAVIDQHFVARDRKARLMNVLAKNPGLVGFGVDERTALVVKGRDLRVLGESTVTVCFAEGGGRPGRTFELKSGATSDLTMLRRAARGRAEAAFPPKEPRTPEVAGKGSLVIVGGGGMPADVTKKFIELAGGPDALIVVLPIANGPVPGGNEGAFLERAGAKNVKLIKDNTPDTVDKAENLELLKKAGGVWFGGGRQWRFVDAYEDTKAAGLMHDLLRRGGVIGGSSAGASIQSEYMPRGSPLGNVEMMCEGYERGLGFLPGVAVDQHFTQRKRLNDMTALMKAYPQLLGVGLDEGTAIVVQGHVAEVMGKNGVHIYDRRKPVKEGEPDHQSLKAGQRYNLKDRIPLAGPVDK